VAAPDGAVGVLARTLARDPGRPIARPESGGGTTKKGRPVARTAPFTIRTD